MPGSRKQNDVKPAVRCVHEGDCLDVVRGFPNDCIDLVYIDPPFASGRRHSAARNGKLPQSFDDLLDVREYIAYMRPRVAELRRVLKPDGTLFYHCDWHAGHYVKVMLDELFGYGNFLNEIVWRYGLGGSSSRYLPRKHDTLYWYARDAGAPYICNAPLVPATSQRLRGQQKKQDDVWEIPALNNMAHERLGYPTQKPLALLERIVTLASAPDAVVLDAFCGSGTTLEAAERHSRAWIGIDSSAEAVTLAKQRMGV